MLAGGALGRCGGIAWRAVAAAVLLLLLPVAVAEASSRLCRQLEAELVSLGKRGNASPAQARRYDSAIQRQEQQMSKARQQAKQAGCGRSMFGSAIGFCGELTATLQRMEKNLAELQRTRTRLGGKSNVREKSRILAAIDVNGCRAPKRSKEIPAEETAALARTSDGANGLPVTPQIDMSGSYRTMCVRSCDGYYFPVSWSVSASAFERDQNVCQNMCPDTKVELHYHRVAGEESEDMISVATGLPYRSMPNAFRYRRSGASPSQGCGCGASAMAGQGFTVIGGDHGNAPSEPRPDKAEAQTAPAESPPTAAEAAITSPPPIRHGDWNPEERPVRIVGPTFLPGPEAAIDLQARDPIPAP